MPSKISLLNDQNWRQVVGIAEQSFNDFSLSYRPFSSTGLRRKCFRTGEVMPRHIAWNCRNCTVHWKPYVRKVESFIPSASGRDWQGCGGEALLLGVVFLGEIRDQLTWEASSERQFPFKIKCHRRGPLSPYIPSRHQSYPIKRPKPFNNIEVSDLLGPAACTQLNSGKKWAFVEKPPFTGKLSLSPEISGNLKKPFFSPGQACGVPQPPLPAIEYFKRLRDRYGQIKSSQSWFYIFNK